MRRAAGFVTAVLLLAVSIVPSARSASTPCVERTVVEQFADADLVITGSVFAVVELDEGGAEVLIEPSVVYKGDDLLFDDTVIVLDETGPGAQTPAEAPFEEGEDLWLLFLRLNEDDETFRTDLCAGTRLLETGLTTEEREALGAGTAIEDLFEPLDGDELIDGDTFDPDSFDGDLSVDFREESDLLLSATDWVLDHRPLAFVGLLWVVVWKGLALWVASRRRQAVWFLLLLVLPTLGVLPIVYLILTQRWARAAAPTV